MWFLNPALAPLVPYPSLSLCFLGSFSCPPITALYESASLFSYSILYLLLAKAITTIIVVANAESLYAPDMFLSVL